MTDDERGAELERLLLMERELLAEVRAFGERFSDPVTEHAERLALAEDLTRLAERYRRRVRELTGGG